MYLQCPQNCEYTSVEYFILVSVLLCKERNRFLTGCDVISERLIEQNTISISSCDVIFFCKGDIFVFYVMEIELFTSNLCKYVRKREKKSLFSFQSGK